MKAIVLAAGRGTRLGVYAQGLPKGMVQFRGQPNLQRQIATMRACGIEDIVLVRGYAPEKIAFENVRYYFNPRFAETNMVVSLFCAEQEFNEDVIVAYADILYETRVLEALKAAAGDVVVVVDHNWRDYWKLRFGNLESDMESLTIDACGAITALGQAGVSADAVDARYVGLIKFSRAGLATAKKIYYAAKDLYWDKPWQVSGKNFANAYMTDFLQAIIDGGTCVNACGVRGGWLEFDETHDFEVAEKIVSDPSLRGVFDMRGLE